MIILRCGILPKPIRLYTAPSYRTMSAAAKWKVYITRRIPPKGLELLKNANCAITQWDRDDAVPQYELMEKVKGQDALFCLLTDKITDEVLASAGPGLKVVGTMSVGFDHIDLESCKRRGIPVGYTPDVLTDATAELTIALLLATARNIIRGSDAVRSGEWGTWAPLWMCGPTLTQSTVGILGMGRIGRATMDKLRSFGVKHFLYTGSGPKPDVPSDQATFTSFDELLSRSDFVIVTCALTPQTKGLLNKSAFEKMKPSAIVINTSRGGVVNQDDLYEALANKTIGGAGLDVTTPEPLPTDHPLLKLDNCVVIPHIGSATFDTRNAMSELCALNILAALKGDRMPAQVC